MVRTSLGRSLTSNSLTSLTTFPQYQVNPLNHWLVIPLIGTSTLLAEEDDSIVVLGR